MSQGVRHIPLSRRLVGRYLVFGLAGVFLCLATALTLAYRNSLTSLAFIAALGPVAVLVIGAIVLHHTTRLNSIIEQQLQRVSLQEGSAGLDAQRIVGSDPVAQGWNSLLERLNDQDVWATLEGRLSDAVGDMRKDQFEAVFQQLPLPVALTEESGRVILANRAFEALAAGVGAVDGADQNIAEFLDFDGASNAAEISTKLKRHHNQVALEVQRGSTPLDGVLQVTRKPLAGDADAPVVQLWTARDITQQLLADEMRNQFVLTATHELRTPLTNIIAYAETLAVEEDIDVAKQKEFCNIINAEATRLSRFVDELLNISQMEAGALSLQRHETDLARLIGEVLEHVKPEMTAKELTLDIQLAPKLPKLQLDKDKFSAAIVNLLGNAAKYTPEGGRVVFHVGLAVDAIEIHVEDSGIGIAEEELPRVFDKFFRSKDQRLQGISGNGLGLAFTQEVVRLHGGNVSVQSELNKGTHFTVTIPYEGSAGVNRV